MDPKDFLAKTFPQETQRMAMGLCPICGDIPTSKGFKDELSKKEFAISGLCQDCQDEMFRETP